MKQIIKQREPNSLSEHRSKQDSDYANLPADTKNELRKSLLKEQGYICCYCMSRISHDNCKIEHYKPQKEYTALQLDYQNMFAACSGNEGTEKALQTCDTHKRDEEISVNPADRKRNCEELIKYQRDGTIYSEDNKINKDLNETLNLNTQTLKYNRSEIMHQVINEITKIKGKNSQWPMQYVQKKIQRYKNKRDGKFIPYCQVVIYFLEKRFGK